MTLQKSYHEKVICVAVDIVNNLKGKSTSLGSIVYSKTAE